MTDSFLAWLDGPDCFNGLRPCARLVIRRAEQLGITLDDSYMESGATSEYHNAVAGNIWQFLREEAESLSSKASRFLVERDCRGLASFISKEFIDSCIDQRRTDSPFHAYYRHVRTVLSEAEGVNYRPLPRKGSYFAWSHRTDLDFLPDGHDFRTKNLHYKEWAASETPFSEIHKKAAVLGLSRHYWSEALRIILTEYLYPIRELVTFVAVKYPLIPYVEYASDVAGEDDGEERQRMPGENLISPGASMDDDFWTHQLPLLAQSIIEVDLEKIAQNCAAKLTGTEKAVLCGLDAFSTMAEIAAQLGMKGPSNVSYHQKSSFEKLRRAWSLWGQPDSEHYAVAEEEQQIFFKKVIAICKGAIACRDSRKEECS